MDANDLPEMTTAELYDTACARIINSKDLDPYYEVIFSDWPNIEDHYHWILTASEEEILDWADKIFCEIVGAEQDEW